MKLTPAVAEAIEEVRVSFDGQAVDVDPDGSGGAWVTVHECDLGGTYARATSWVSFTITFQYPDADVYPHFLAPDLARNDGKALGSGFGSTKHPRTKQPVTQVSRRSNKRNAETDTAAAKLWKVLTWIREQ